METLSCHFGCRMRCPKAQPAGGLMGLGDVALEQLALVPRRWIGPRNGFEERLGVGVARIAVKLGRRGQFDDFAEIHHRDPVAHVLDHAEIVGDEEVGEPVLLLEFEKEVQHLRLHRDIEGGNGLITDDEAGFQGEGPGDPDPLALAPGNSKG